MRQDREHPLYYLDAETLLVAIYIWVDDKLKALQAQGFKLPPKQRHQKATLAELLTLAIFLLLQGQDLAKGYLAAKTTLKAYFPSLPHLSRFYRVLQKAPGRLAHLAVRLSGGQGLLPTFRTPLTPGGNIALPPAGAPRSHDGGPGWGPGVGRPARPDAPR